jgi:hypothetical protein
MAARGLRTLIESELEIIPLCTLQTMILNESCKMCQLCYEAIGKTWNMSKDDISKLTRPVRCWLKNTLCKLMRSPGLLGFIRS